MELNHVYLGENLDILRTFPDNSIDALVCDPPGAIRFLGNEWDSNKGGRKQWIAAIAEIMRECLRVLRPGAHGLVWALPRTSHWTMCALEDAGFEIRDVIHHIFPRGLPKGENQLKTAVEYWVLIRKPLSEKSLTKQIRTTGTGAINIDVCRIEAHDTQLAAKFASVRNAPPRINKIYGQDHRKRSEGRLEPHPGGRWPSHLIFTHARECLPSECFNQCPVALLDTQSNVGASRFFTQLDHEDTPQFYYSVKSLTDDRTMNGLVANDHPTPKNTRLMSWLNKLITPPGGVILDCFCGSGSTLVAARRDGFRFIGIDNKKEYVDIAEHRLATLDEL